MNIEHDTGYFVLLTARAFTKVAEARLRSIGLGVAHMPVLAALAADGPLTQKDIAARIHVEQPTAATLLQRMDAAGLILRSPDPHDRRATRIALSERGAALLPEAMALRHDAVVAATSGLSPSEVESLNGLLSRVLANLDSLAQAHSQLPTDAVGPKEFLDS